MLKLLFATALAVATYPPAPALADGATAPKLKMVTTTTDLHSIAHAIGGDRVSVVAISAGYQDPHFVEAKPSFILQLQKADIFAFVGLDLEIGWMPVLVEGARNPNIRPGGSGYLDVSKVIPVIDLPSRGVDRSQGDVHALGNPHYWLDPANGRRIAKLYRDKFAELDPAGASTYDANLKDFEARLTAAEKSWQPLLAQIKGKPVVAWHTSWRYLAEYTGMNIVGFMEPKPGVPPSPAHLAGLIQTIKRTGAKVIIMEPFYNRKTADLVASKTSVKVLQLPPSVNGIKQVTDYIGLLDYDLKQLAAGVR